MNPICIGLFGPNGVGKSSIIYKCLFGIFSDKYIPTIEDCYFHHIQGKYCCIIDSSGNLGGIEASVRRKSIEDVHIAILVHDVTKIESLEEIVLFLDEINACKNNPLLYLVSNKIDLIDEIKGNDVIEKAQSMARKYNIHTHKLLSAKDGDGIKTLFDNAIQEILKNHEIKKENCCIIL